MCSEPLKEIDNSRFEIHLLGMVVDHNSILSDCGVSHNDAVTLQLIPDSSTPPSTGSFEAAKITELSNALQQERQLSAQYLQQISEKDAEITQYLSDIQERDETIAQLHSTIENLQKKIDQLQAGRFRHMERKHRAEPGSPHASDSNVERLRASAANEWKMSEEDQDLYAERYRVLGNVNQEVLLLEMSNKGIDDASGRDMWCF